MWDLIWKVFYFAKKNVLTFYFLKSIKNNFCKIFLDIPESFQIFVWSFLFPFPKIPEKQESILLTKKFEINKSVKFNFMHHWLQKSRKISIISLNIKSTFDIPHDSMSMIRIDVKLRESKMICKFHMWPNTNLSSLFRSRISIYVLCCLWIST